MKSCERCGNPVTETFHRVNSDNAGDLWSCPSCNSRGTPLTGPDDDNSSEMYDKHLDKIRSGISIKEIRGES